MLELTSDITIPWWAVPVAVFAVILLPYFAFKLGRWTERRVPRVSDEQLQSFADICAPLNQLLERRPLLSADFLSGDQAAYQRIILARETLLEFLRENGFEPDLQAITRQEESTDSSAPAPKVLGLCRVPEAPVLPWQAGVEAATEEVAAPLEETRVIDPGERPSAA